MPARIATLCLVGLLASPLLGCGGTEDLIGLSEPLQVQQAEFKDGALPGTVAVEGTPLAAPTITSLSVNFGVLRPGVRGASISGRTSSDAYSVGVRFKDLGTGYWIHAVNGEDALIPNELTWALALDASIDITPGKHDLEVVAFDARGNAGTKQNVSLCIASDLPDNLNVCDPKNEPPLVMASLTWNTDADLDLTVVAPDGTTFGRSKRSLLSGGRVIARLDGDGVSGCLADGRRRETFAWFEAPPAGAWNIYVNLFDACAKPAVDFVLTFYQRQPSSDGSYVLVPLEAQRVTGQLVRAQANGGLGNPLFVSDIKF